MPPPLCGAFTLGQWDLMFLVITWNYHETFLAQQYATPIVYPSQLQSYIKQCLHDHTCPTLLLYTPPQLTCVTFLHSPAKSSPALILILVILLHLPSIPAHVKMKLPAVTNSCHAARFPVMIMVYIDMINPEILEEQMYCCAKLHRAETTNV